MSFSIDIPNLHPLLDALARYPQLAEPILHRATGHHRRLLLVGGILGDFPVYFLDRICGEHQRSISPKTMSCVPMMATASASMWPRAISSSAARCGKPGARIFRR